MPKTASATDENPDGAPSVAYLSMEIGLRTEFHTYSGGLGVLAGDTVRAAADLEVPMVAVTLVHRKGYFRQGLDEEGNQVEDPDPWSPEDVLEEVDPVVHVEVEGRSIVVRAWVHRVRGITGGVVAVFFLDTDLEENEEEDRELAYFLYGGDERYRLRQEAILGLGAVALLRALGFDRIRTFHMNEGHSSLVSLGLLEEEMGTAFEPGRAATGARSRRKRRGAKRRLPDPGLVAEAIGRVRARCVFTTHTPVDAGHDRFPIELVREVLGPGRAALLEACGVVRRDVLNMSELAIRHSRFVNAVALRHGQISREMFPGATIEAITNGVHTGTWIGPGFRALFNQHLPQWERDPFLLRHAVAIPLNEIREAHRDQKNALLTEVEWRTGRRLDPEVFTIVFARRATPYKRAGLLLADPAELRAVAKRAGHFQILYAGKAHPKDELGKDLIRQVVETGKELGDDVPLVYLENYTMELGALLAAGADLWLNTPTKPLEASGTSGMKAALNGVPSLSVLDGWWVEGHVEGVTGWAVGEEWWEPSDYDAEAASVLERLEETILPLYYQDPDGWARVMRGAVALNGSHFHASRMMLEYVNRAYRIARSAPE